MNIPVLTKLQLKLSDLKERVKLTDACTKPRKFRSYTASSDESKCTLSGVIEYTKRWMDNPDSVPKPTDMEELLSDSERYFT